MIDLRTDIHNAINAELDGERREIAIAAADKAFGEACNMPVTDGLRYCIRAIAAALAEGVRD